MTLWKAGSRFYFPLKFLHLRICKKKMISFSFLSLVKQGIHSQKCVVDRVYQHAQLNGQHSHSGLLLWLLFSLPQRLGSSCVTHVSKANFGNIEPLSLHTHTSHVLPDSLAVRNGKENKSCYGVTFKACARSRWDAKKDKRVKGKTICTSATCWM